MGFAVMSDGAAESLYQRRKGVLAPALIRILSRFEEHPSTVVTNDIRESVMSLLTSRTRDDCSLAVLRQAHVDLGDLRNKSEAFQMEILGTETRLGLRIRLLRLVASEDYRQAAQILVRFGTEVFSDRTVRHRRQILENLPNPPAPISVS